MSRRMKRAKVNISVNIIIYNIVNNNDITQIQAQTMPEASQRESHQRPSPKGKGKTTEENEQDDEESEGTLIRGNIITFNQDIY